MLFICVHNSARSQMAEAFLARLGGERVVVASAGIEPGTLNPLAVAAMREVGIDISGNAVKSVESLVASTRFDYVITVCDPAAAERCPVFPGKTVRMHWGFEDPSSFAGTWEERLARTRQVRDRIERKVRAFVTDIVDRASA